MCQMQLKGRKRARHLMLMLAMIETVDQLAMGMFIGVVMC